MALCRAIAEPFLEIGNDVACRPADHRNRHARLPNRADDKETVVEIGERAPEARNLLMSGVVSVIDLYVGVLGSSAQAPGLASVASQKSCPGARWSG